VVQMGTGDNIAGDKVVGDKIGTQINHYRLELAGELSTPNNLPVSHVTAFVGRADDLVAVDGLLMANQQVNIAAAVGMGGVGKTELALQYAQRRGDAFPGGVCWLRGVTPIAPQIIGFADAHLGLKVPEQVENPVAWCCQRWPNEGPRKGPVLMVVDDVQDYGALKPLLPSGQRFRVLLTTRQAILPVGQRLALEVLVPEAALDLLKSLAGVARVEAELDAAKELCEWVGRLPLGIELIGWYLQKRPGLTLAALLARLEEKRLAAQALMQTHPEMTATLGVAAAFELSWEPLSVGAKTLAGLLGLFAAAPIEWDWVRASVAKSEAALAKTGLVDEEALEEAQAELLGVNLLQVSERQGGLRYQVHPLVREFFAVKRGELAGADGLQRGFAEVMTAIAKTIPQMVTLTDQARVEFAVPHLAEVAQQWTAVLGEHDKITCSARLAWFYQSLSLWTKAEECCQRSLEISKSELGDRHPDTAQGLNNLAALYQSQGQYAKAEPLYLEALEIKKSELGDRHPDTAQGLNNLASLYESQGQYAKAEPLYLEALEIKKSELGNLHPSTASSLNNLAGLYRSQGQYAKAEPLYLEALKISKSELGNHHPNIATSLNNLALLYQSQGRYVDAEPLYRQALEINQSELSDLHPNTAQGLNNLAGLYKSQGRYADAEPLYRQALEINQSELGDLHPNTAQGLNNLAGLYQLQGRYADAEPLYRQALQINQSALSDLHPDTAISLNNLALLYQSQGRYVDAEPLYRQALEINQSALGDRHPNTAQGLNNLALLYQSQGRYADAEPLYRQALQINQSALGDRHPDTATSLNNLADLYLLQGRYVEAEPLLIEALEISKSALGDRHPDTANSLNNLAALYFFQGRYYEAIVIMFSVVSIFEELLGPNHPNTITARGNLEVFQQQINDEPTW
jgi:tetratricopeptide (TPR) repeat protein